MNPLLIHRALASAFPFLAASHTYHFAAVLYVVTITLFLLAIWLVERWPGQHVPVLLFTSCLTVPAYCFYLAVHLQTEGDRQFADLSAILGQPFTITITVTHAYDSEYGRDGCLSLSTKPYMTTVSVLGRTLPNNHPSFKTTLSFDEGARLTRAFAAAGASPAQIASLVPGSYDGLPH
jgi:hypothetical protein